MGWNNGGTSLSKTSSRVFLGGRGGTTILALSGGSNQSSGRQCRSNRRGVNRIGGDVRIVGAIGVRVLVPTIDKKVTK